MRFFPSGISMHCVRLPGGAGTELPAPFHIGHLRVSLRQPLADCLAMARVRLYCARGCPMLNRFESAALALFGVANQLIAQGAFDLNLQLVSRRFDGVVVARVAPGEFVHAPLLVLLHM